MENSKFIGPVLAMCIAGAFFFLFAISSSNKYRDKYLKYNIKGKIDSFYKDEQESPHVDIKGKSYQFLYYWDQRIELHEGDSIYKEAGKYDIELFDEKGNLKYSYHDE